MQVDIITPDENLFTGDAKSLVVPASNGQLGILENHAPLIASLGDGKIKLTNESGDQFFDIKGGVIEVNNNTVIILAG